MDLNTPASELPLVGPVYVSRLKRLDINTIGDLLHHVPSRYLDFRLTSEIRNVRPGETVTLRGQIVSMDNIYTKKGTKIQAAKVKDSTGEIEAIWFNQPFLVRNLPEGTIVSLAGKVDWFGRKIALISPEYEKVLGNKKSLHTGRLVPIYPETSGISSKWMRGKIAFGFDQVQNNIEDNLPTSILKNLNLVDLSSAISSVHFPKTLEEVEEGKKRLAFDELLRIQLNSLWKKKKWEQNKASFRLSVKIKDTSKFLKKLPFKLTASQDDAVKEILDDLGKDNPMNRLLEGDVGSGKTVVAAIAAFACFLNEHQTVFMAPTQILAEQHFKTLKQMFSPFKVRISLITSDGIKKDFGRSDIFVGTHALLHKKLDLANVALVVIDEQHKFGVKQRARLIRKSGNKSTAPHILTMTATPIPRTIALTFYGDLDLSTLTELPKGRKPIKTWTIPPQKRESAYQWVGEQINENQAQVFVIVPLIEESEKETMKQIKAATSEYKAIKKIFPKLSIGLLHGRLKTKDKNKVIDLFKKGSTDILVSTPVVEVGIDVPAATIMLIEAAERFGLAQLHQLRGRIGRGEKESYCLLFAETKSPKVQARLNALKITMSGFELAELDLKLRGPGEIFGTKQHGFPELKIASWQDTELIIITKGLAQKVFKNPKKYKKLSSRFNKGKILTN
ncbi:ATP-dependent DNA helicase RecG [Patescibacteria group bacterium]|nr:ATP-dependent DNA helicase RecG [Patescibacteria group bacterium]MBU0777085.1 ATP-dependent DNA helicase RecG [Patescibacteria group bacterium]MBU0845779.1 ATP-dependent DNA helicase RecG [Patescibacteria group bacterium]MBU0922806.1 ATP-dependent DNA helicase RecG [Patescibacteria group bacterium]MBU1066461.1 ATP-dependent DNA helicase RecG [Patescibacteria group bacterium]